MAKLDYKDIFSVIDDYDVFLFDLWGVIVEGEKTYHNVVEHINYVINSQKKVFFVTNAPRTANHLLEKIHSWGINATDKMVVSSGQVAIDMILESNERFAIDNPLIYHLGSEHNNLIDGIDIDVTTNINESNILLLTIHRDESKDLNLNEFDELFKVAIDKNMVVICANPDLGIRQHGVYRYCSGYFANKIKELGGNNIIYAGKPYKEIYYKIMKRLPDNISKDRILMIGDTFYTDILGAKKTGINSALVLTGNSRKYHEQFPTIEEKLQNIAIAAAKQDLMPNFVIELRDKV